jgi:hypothetical protein
MSDNTDIDAQSFLDRLSRKMLLTTIGAMDHCLDATGSLVFDFFDLLFGDLSTLTEL